MKANWIWINGKEVENQRICFADYFEYQGGDVSLEICAVTRYIVYLNGEEIGRGPIRSGKGTLYYDTYELGSVVRAGRNYLAVRVWDYGWSTYQSIAAQGMAWYQVIRDGEALAASGPQTRCARDLGHQSHAPKRNVNLGFSDYYDARAFDSQWMTKPETPLSWDYATILPDYEGQWKQNPLKPYEREERRPERMVKIQEVKKGCQQVTVNTRKAFFGDRRDAHETIFSGFLGCVFQSEAMEGEIAFPARMWNGIQGDFTLDGVLYPVCNESREPRVSLTAGAHLFLLQISGKYDDLFCHLEFRFPTELDFEGRFFVIGPTGRIEPILDGFSTVYGGLVEYNRMEHHSQHHQELFAAATFAELEALAGPELVWVDREYVFWDQYLYSLATQAVVLKEYSPKDEHMGILWKNQDCTLVEPPQVGDSRRMIVDFGDIYAGSLEFSLWAPEGAVLDIYCFENMYHGEIDFTVGLNNGVRYVCRQGWQTYRCMARMGMRYAVLTVSQYRQPVRIQDFHILASGYSSANCGAFQCDDFLLNRIWEMCRRTHRLCMEDSFTDCPTYEQAFWIGDAGVSTTTNLYLCGEYSLIRHNLELAVTAAANTRLLNALTPTDWDTAIPMWTMNWIAAIDQYVRACGDTALLQQLYPAMRDTLHYYAGFIQEGEQDGAFLINAWNMLDWADMDIHNHGVVTGQQALLAYCYRLGAAAAEFMGEEESGYFTQCSNRLLSYIDRVLWDNNRRMFLDGWTPESGLSKTVSIQTHTLLALYGGITDPEKAAITRQYLAQPPEEFVQAGSPFMLFYLYETWAQKGEITKVLQDVKLRWGEMLKYNSTTCWEVFPGFYEVSRTRSYCHSWSATPAYFMIRYGLGFALDGSFEKITAAALPQGLHWCRGSIPTPKGPIAVDWTLEACGWECRLRIPEGIELDTTPRPEVRFLVERTAAN